MSISSIQKKRKTKEFSSTLLKKGIEPNNFELNKMLTEYFDNHTIGMPYYAPKKQNPYEPSSKKDYNYNFSGIKEDLDVIYEANIEANNKAVAMQEYYDLEKIKVTNALNKLNLRVKNLSEAIKTSSYVKQYSQVFEDMYDIELYGDKKRNIPYTTSFIDLLQKKVYTDKTNSNVNKISLDNASINILNMTSLSNIYKQQGDINNILSDINTDIYCLLIHSLNETNTLTIEVDIGKLVTFNTVSFSFSASKELECELLLSEDGDNYISVYKVLNKDLIEWNFNAKTARYFKIICYKSDADGVTFEDSNVGSYEHYYIFKNISVSSCEFENKSIFVSKIIDFDDLTSTIKLDATDMIFNNTRIDYFIGFDNEKDKIGWDAIENHKEHKLFMFDKRHKILNSHITKNLESNTDTPNSDFGTQDVDTHLYKIFKIPNTVNRNSIKVTPGYNMWSVKRYNREEGDLDDGFSLVASDLTDMTSQSTVTTLFMDCDNYDKFPIRSNVLYIFTQFIDLDKAKNLYNTFIKVVDKESYTEITGQEIRVFLNGTEIVSSKTDKYSFGLRKGVNKIQIAIYVSSTNDNEFCLYHNINFKALTNNVFACVPMKYTTNTILEKMAGDTYEYYTIKDNYIYVKNNPLDMISSDLDDMGYFISYYTLKEDMAGYFKDNHIKFRIMAILTSNDKNVSPEILNFRLTGK